MPLYKYNGEHEYDYIPDTWCIGISEFTLTTTGNIKSKPVNKKVSFDIILLLNNYKKTGISTNINRYNNLYIEKENYNKIINDYNIFIKADNAPEDKIIINKIVKEIMNLVLYEC